MRFDNIKIKEIQSVLKYIPDKPRFSAKNRNNHIIGIQISGNATHTFANKELIFKESCIYFLNKKEDYNVRINEPGIAFSIHFTTYEEIETESFCIKTGNPQKIIRVLENAEKSFYIKNELKLCELTYGLCAQIYKIYKENTCYGDVRIIRAESYMRQHFREDGCLNVAVEKSMLSKRRFNDLFKQYYAETPNNYLLNLKIENAKTLIKSECISISQISSICGFNDAGYFCNVFKKITGLSPTEYRKIK